MNVIIYSRVSTKTQSYSMQTIELQGIASNRGYSVLNVFEEVISGAKKNIERPALQDMISFIQSNNARKVLVYSLDRLGRNLAEVLNTLDILNSLKVSLYIKTYDLETLDEKGNPNPLAQFMVSLLGSVAALERQQIRTRMESGYRAYREKGGRVGRKLGSTVAPPILLEKHREAVKLLKQGYSVRKVSKLTDRSVGTVQKVKKLIDAPPSK
jgi:DNA invertase Pin-like site-specific DNA recombinase